LLHILNLGRSGGIDCGKSSDLEKLIKRYFFMEVVLIWGEFTICSYLENIVYDYDDLNTNADLLSF